jgi:hypothetical protein
MHALRKYTVQEAKFPVKNLIRQRCAEGFNSGVKGLTIVFEVPFVPHNTASYTSVHKPGEMRSVDWIFIIEELTWQ